MSYEKIRKLLQGSVMDLEIERANERKRMAVFAYLQAQLLTNPQLREQMSQAAREAGTGAQNDLEMLQPKQIQVPTAGYLPMTKKIADSSRLSFNTSTNKVEGGINITDQEVTPEEMFGSENNSTLQEDQLPPTETTGPTKKEKMQKASMAMGIIGNAAIAAINQVDNATMGDKNFSASSLAIDAGVHGLSGTMMSSGNPYLMASAVALEGLNFVTKAGGKNIQGYNVNINNSGYGNLGHQESEAGRIWDKWSGATTLKLKRRNEQARMALSALDISENTKYEQEARANSVDNVLRQNQIALAGGIDTSLLAN